MSFAAASRAAMDAGARGQARLGMPGADPVDTRRSFAAAARAFIGLECIERACAFRPVDQEKAVAAIIPEPNPNCLKLFAGFKLTTNNRGTLLRCPGSLR